VLLTGGTATATPTPVGLGSAGNFAVLAGSQITDVPTSAITGDVGLSPGSGAAIGLACVEVTGTIYSVDAAGPLCFANNPGLLTTARSDALTAFNHTSALSGATPLAVDLAGQSLVSGLYSFGAGATNLSGTLTLNAQSDPNAVWIFQASSSLITSAGSTVTFSNLPPGTTAAQLACNVYWTVGSSATLNSATTFVGTILASADITLVGATGTTVTGRLLAGNGATGKVTLDHDTIIRPTGCAALPAGTGGTPATTTTTTPVVQVVPNFTG
jgi:Ice-binding-like